MNDGRHSLVSGAPQSVGENMAMDPVSLRMNEWAHGIGKPAVLARMPVLPLLDLVELPSPVHIGIVQDVVGVPGPAPGLVGIGQGVGEDAKRLSDVCGDEPGANPLPC